MIKTFIKGQSGTQPWPLYGGGGLLARSAANPKGSTGDEI
jgi:hypothetical protein